MSVPVDRVPVKCSISSTRCAASRDKQVHDFIDPDFLRVDAGIAKRAKDARKEIERVLGIKESQ